MADKARLAELLASFAFAGDLGHGQSLGHVLATTELAMRLADELGLSSEQKTDVYYTGLLIHAGCTAGASDIAQFMVNDEIGILAELCVSDPDNVAQIMKWLATNVAPGWPLYLRVTKTLQALAKGEKVFMEMGRGYSEAGASIAARLEMPVATQMALYNVCETWNGKGPHGLRGADVPLATRIVSAAMTLEVIHVSEGQDSANEAAIKRRGKSFDPDVADAFLAAGDGIWDGVSREDSWDAVLAIEPPPWRFVEEAGLENVALALADFADLKTPRTPSHSRDTAELAEAIAIRLGLSEAERALTRRAALVHDIGQLGVPSLVLEKQGSLSTAEQERLQLHPYYTDRVLSRSSHLQPIGQVASAHHERLDGHGYFRGLLANQISMPARALAIADRFIELKQSRNAHETSDIGGTLAALKPEVGSAFDPDCYDALAAISGAGADSRPRRTAWPAHLTDREVEVLRLAARGLSIRELADQLVVSPHTARHHLESIYDKINVSTRAGATLFAVEHELLN